MMVRVLAFVLVTACMAGCGSSAPSAACRQAAARADAYATWVRTDTSYPDDPVQEGLGIMAHELRLLRAMGRAGCPGDTPVVTLP